MKKITFLLFFLISFSTVAQQQTIAYSINPATFNEGDIITITFNGSSINESTWSVTGNALYLWAWSYDLNDTNSLDCPTNGTWSSSNEANRLTYNAGSDTYTISFTPTTFYSRTDIGRIGFLLKPKNGKPSTIDKKSQDIYSEVGSFQVTLTNPINNSATVLSSGGNLNITATNTNGNAGYNLKANGISINSNPSTTSFAFNHTNITTNQNYELEITQTSTTVVKKFSVIVNPNISDLAIPEGFVDGINYDSGDATLATLVIDAPFKDFIYVAGSFNNWQPNETYAMKKDPSSTKFWLELTGLTPGQIETYQYWLVDQTPIANSPVLVKTADPFSTLILSPFDDPGIPSASYPNLPTYPTGQEREVTVLQTNQISYPWQVTTFSKPKKEDLIIYEVLIRDFDTDRNFQDLIDKIDYFKNLNINAIELMPIMEYEGNESWGYNTAFHMALDKYYGTSDKFKELVDLYHQNGIAVILDIALNHAFGRNPMNRMWMNDPDNDGWGSPSSENPYFNTTAKHSYSVGEDFNHQSTYTQNYVKRVVNHWISEYKIDGFRWDLTKGFTQNCTSGDQTCTNNYQQDRVDILKQYADYSWAIDPTHYVIFEHLGGDTEEQQWANYRVGDAIPKGIMMWGIMYGAYKEFALGFNSNISRATSESRGFTKRRLIPYPESHDEERLMYDMSQFGNTTNTLHNVRNLNTALSRMSAIGATSLLIPGPKMIWHFGALGMNNSIYTCNNSTVSNPNCKLDTKPQPQWTNNWLADVNRNKIYNDWAKLNELKINEPVFEGNATLEGTTRTVRLFIWDDAIPSTALKNVVVLANFYTVDQSITPDFPYIGTWYDLMDNTSINVTSTTALIPVAAGQFRIFGNKPSTLSTTGFNGTLDLTMYPNPTSTSFQINKAVDTVSIYDITGKLISNYKGGFQKNDEFNISSISQGLYIVKFESNKASVSKRLIIN
jgi:hypothetical protein